MSKENAADGYSAQGDPLLQDLPEVDGYKLVGSCLIYGPLGKGGMGQVYRGRHLNFDLDIAIKCLDRDLAKSKPEFVDRFVREAQVAAKLTNENLIRVYETGEKTGVYYLVMEFVEGETARARVGRKGPLAPDEALTIIQGATRGLAAAHRSGVIHRDIKPDNILISHEGEVKLADLGLAKESSDDGMTMTGQGMGTPQYMPPEQFRDFKSTGKEADVYSMGATLYFLLTGQRPFPGSSVHEVMHKVCLDGFPDIAKQRPDLDADIVELVRRATAAEPGDRYADAVELLEVIHGLGDDSTFDLADPHAGDVEVPTLVSPPPKTLAEAKLVAQTLTMTGGEGGSGRKRRGWIVAAAAVGLMAAAGLAVKYWPESTSGSLNGGAPAKGSTGEGNGPTSSKKDTGGSAAKGSVETVGGGSKKAAAVSVEPSTPPATSGEHTQNGLQAKEAGRFFDAVTHFRNAQDNQEEGAASHLADALFSLAEAIRKDDPAEAYRYASESKELSPSQDTQKLIDNLRGDIRTAIEKSVSVVSPPGLATSTAAKPLEWRSEAFELSGSVSYPEIRSVTINGETLPPEAEFTWKSNLAADSVHRIELAIVDSNEIEFTREYHVRVDTMAPTLDLIYPQELEITPGKHKLEGRVSDSGTSWVKINGEEVRPDADGNWTHELEVTEGTNSIEIQAGDGSGNEAPPILLEIKTPWPKLPGFRIRPGADGPPWVYTSERDSSVELILVEPSEGNKTIRFDMGTDEYGDFSPSAPVNSVELGPYLFGRLEVTNAQFLRFLTETERSKERLEPLWDDDYSSTLPNHPVINVTHAEARAYCEWLGLELPTEAQWEYAATGGTKRRYPWGEGLAQASSRLVNYSGYEDSNERSEDVVERETKAKEDGYKNTAEVGAMAEESFIGARDLGGNVSEWCRDGYVRYSQKATAGSGLRSDITADARDAIVRGGNWTSTLRNLESRRRDYKPPDRGSETIGFRVALDLRDLSSSE